MEAFYLRGDQCLQEESRRELSAPNLEANFSVVSFNAKLFQRSYQVNVIHSRQLQLRLEDISYNLLSIFTTRGSIKLSHLSSHLSSHFVLGLLP